MQQKDQTKINTLEKKYKKSVIKDFGWDGQNHLRQKRCKLEGVEEDKIEGVTQISNSNFSTYKDGCLTSNFGLKNVRFLTFCIQGVLSNIFCLKKNIYITIKKIQKKSFSQKKISTECKYQKCCEAKKAYITLPRDPISYFEKYFYIQSTYSNFYPSLTKFLYTLMSNVYSAVF